MVSPKSILHDNSVFYSEVDETVVLLIYPVCFFLNSSMYRLVDVVPKIFFFNPEPIDQPAAFCQEKQDYRQDDHAGII